MGPFLSAENKAQSSVGRAWFPKPKKFKTQCSDGKIMARVFWDAKIIPHSAYSPDLALSDYLLFLNLSKRHPWILFPVL